MSALQRHRLQATVLVVVFAALAGSALAEDLPPASPRVSQRLSDAILVEFRTTQTERPAVFEETVGTNDPGIVVLREFEVRGRRDIDMLSPEKLVPPTQATPIALGSGITEYKGRKYTVLTQRLLFIPFGLKITW